MAQVLKGSFNTTAYGGRYLTLSWTATQDIANNTSTISWSLVGGGGGDGYYKTSPIKVVIAGETVYEYTSSTRISLYSGTKVASGTKVITHNTNGSKSFSASVSAAIYYKDVNCSGSATWELQSIPRKATIVTAPNFNDLNIPTVTYSNLVGNAVDKLEIGVFNTEGSQSLAPYREISKTGTSYTFQFTEAERNNLRNYTPNSNTATVKFYIRTTINGTYYLDSVSKTLTIINANPLLDVVIEDKGANTSEMAGAGVIVKHRSAMYVSCEATALKGASLASCSITNSGKSTSNWNGTFLNPTDSVVTCVVTDSRGNSTTQTIDLANNNLGYTWVPYIAPTCSMAVSMVLDTSTTSKASISASGDYYNGAIGVTNNALTVCYGVWEDGVESAVRTGVITNVDLNGNKYNATIDVAGLNYQKTYRFMCWAYDVLPGTTVYSDEQSLSTLPIFDWSKEDFNFNVPVSFNGFPMVDFIVEQGTEAMGSNGTWYWQKWASGKAECWGQRNYGNMGVSTAWGSLYASPEFNQALPSGLFVGVPTTCNIQYLKGKGNAWIASGYDDGLSATTTSKFNVVRAVSGTLSQVHLGFYVIGRWK